MKTFKVMTCPVFPRSPWKDCPTSVPWEAIAPYEEQVLRNHGQTLETLNNRGGCSPAEIFAIVNSKTYYEMWPRGADTEACVQLIKDMNNVG